MGRTIKTWLPPQYGFVLLVTSYGENGTTLYCASIGRLDALQLMREFIAHNREERNFEREMPELEAEEEFNAWWDAQNKRGEIQDMHRWCRDAFLAGRATA